MMTLLARALCLSVPLLFVVPVLATTYVVPDERSLFDRSKLIVTGVVVASWSEVTSRGHIETVYRISVDEVLKGEQNGILEIRELGGRVGDRAMLVSGAPDYATGERYLIFMSRRGQDRLSTVDLFLGGFRFTREGGRQVLVRSHAAAHQKEAAAATADADMFLQSIRRMNRSSTAVVQRSIPVEARSTNLDLQEAAVNACAQWSSGSLLDLTIAATASSGNSVRLDGEERIMVDHPGCDNGECIPGSFDGTGIMTTTVRYMGVASGGAWYIHETDIILQDGVNTSNYDQNRLNTAIAQEIGHSVGFRHSDKNNEDNGPCQTDASSYAVMASAIAPGVNGTLQDWDKRAVSTSYPDPTAMDWGTEYLFAAGSYSMRRRYSQTDDHQTVVSVVYHVSSDCAGPSIQEHPLSHSIATGSSTTLSVSATPSAGELSYQWYLGEAGDLSLPVTGGTDASLTVTPDATSAYWVRVMDACEASNTADSLTATITVVDPGALDNGDVNGDGAVNVPDVFYMINFLFGSGSEPIGSGDVNGDGTFSVADIFYMINWIFAGGSPPV
ncbi:MAG: hypothetical protein KY432_06785 [Acidobacteria bacterium]|nr:hypothetical protein [Acidobacteriota bacterium]